MTLFLLFIMTYLIGSVPFGLLIGRFMFGIDVRQQGSGNIGMTNVMRVGGKLPGILTFLADFLKGFIPVFFVGVLYTSQTDVILWQSLVAVIAVLGHVFPIYLKFRGGKGVATTFGILFALQWQIGLICAAIWLTVFLKTRISSLSALCMLITLPISLFVGYWIDKINFPLHQTLLLSTLSLFIIHLHKDNIVRLRHGEEKKL